MRGVDSLISPSIDVRICKATAGDADVLGQLVCALADYEHLPRPSAEALERLKRDGFGPAPRFDAWLAWVQNQAVGYAVAFFTYSTFLAMPTLYLEDLFVLPEYRALGIGRRLFLACAEHGRAHGCGRMEWQVLNWNTPAIRFYHRLGAYRLEEWLPYRLTREQIDALLDGTQTSEMSTPR
ncbi:MAG: GNAT family N-acetyltransferase [Anaerolineae bacterium]|nr:GNAT family N-acetyltransferase [Thermoflexales bacterium]MDW8406980.1 GNAT family N-acetyltransferase [Anaerolineae bacterium]